MTAATQDLAAPASTEKRLLRVDGLTVDYVQGRNRTHAVRNVSFTIAPGETVALVGESGSGKSTTAHAVLGLLHREAQIVEGSLVFEGQDLRRLNARAWRRLRGAGIGFVPQDPLVSLNPVRRVGDQVAEVLRIHRLATGGAAWQQAIELLDLVGIPDAATRVRQYPSEFSGGMRQRVLIAIALAASPRLLIADEPTSALDVTVQKQILDHIEREVAQRGAGLLLVTHDLGVAADRADRILVFSGGRLVESGTPEQILHAPGQPYTKRLIAAAPSLRAPSITSLPRSPEPDHRPPVVIAAEHLAKRFQLPGRRGTQREFLAVDALSFDIHAGETLALVGESGSGKSTTARLVLRLEELSGGALHFEGVDYTHLHGAELRALRQRLTLVYQSPFASLDPGFTIQDVLEEPLRNFGIGTRRHRAATAAQLLDEVGLPRTYLQRRPAELSGGQRQRVAIARALSLEPRLIVLDEPVSSLDVSIQAQILDLLVETQRRTGVSYLFISHDLAVVRQISHRVAVLQRGRLQEIGDTGQVLSAPASDYTKQLIAAIPGRARQPQKQ